METRKRHLANPHGQKDDLSPSLYQDLGLVVDAIRRALKHWLRHL